MITSMIWLPATLLAGFLQAWRTAVQRRARDILSVNAAGLVRYLYGLPVAMVLLGTYLIIIAGRLPTIGPLTIVFAAAAGIAQILATNLLIMAFGYRNFVVGTAYSKTEAVQGAILAFLLLGERLTLISWLGIAVGVLGVISLSTGGRRLGGGDFLRDLRQPAALCGLSAGFLFALTSVGVKRATLEVATNDKVLAALIVLVITMSLQTVIQGSYIRWREREQLLKIFTSWRVSGQVGVLAALGSGCWFTGFATAPVALVRIVGQVEIVFTLCFAHFYLRERAMRSEVYGLLLLSVGVMLAVAGSA